MQDFLVETPLVQPHGALLVLDARNLRIVGVSESVRSIFGLGTHDLLGHPIERLAAGAKLGDVRTALEAREPFELTTHSRRRLHASCTHRGDFLVLSLEPADVASTFGSVSRLRSHVARLREATSLDELSARVTDQIRAVSGFDRVVVRASGEESSTYFVSTTSYEPSRVVVNDTAVLPDLRCAELYSPSSDALADLRARGITATMEIGGLISGYHASGEHRVSHEARVACGLIAEVYASLVDQHRRVELVSTGRFRARKVA